uniref:Uncharacterized protein n=1 Tax=Salix viminalis TaxID=40686 RepID=A0A6N2MFF2_SALVM
MIESFGQRALAERLVVPMDFKRKPWEQKLPLHQSQRHQWESFPVGFSGGGITKGYAAEEIKNADPSTGSKKNARAKDNISWSINVK